MEMMDINMLQWAASWRTAFAMKRNMSGEEESPGYTIQNSPKEIVPTGCYHVA
jgi:hypothetical protein